LLTQTGAITLHGTGGGGDVPLSARNDGVWINGAVRQTANGGGLVSITGDGILRPGLDEENTGVYIGRDGVALVSTIDGPIEITGTGRGALQDAYNANDGIRINRLGTRIETVSGNINLDGTGGGGEDSNRGIRMNADTLVTTADGAIRLVGQGGGGFQDSNANSGIELDAARVTATGSGAVTLEGRGGGAATDDSNDNYGIRLLNAGAKVETVGGQISLTGIAGRGETQNRGVVIDTNTALTTATGAIALRGTGGGGNFAGSVRNDGILVNGIVQQTAAGGGTVTLIGDGLAGANFGGDNNGVNIGRDAVARVSTSGELRLTGTASGTAADGVSGNDGVRILRAGTVVETRSNASLVVNGTGGPGEDSNRGLFTDLGITLSSQGGDLALTGRGGGGFEDSNANYGLLVQCSLSTTGTGKISGNGTGGGNLADASNDNDGVRITGAGTSCTTADGDIVFTGQGGPGEDSNRGVFVQAGARLFSTGGTIDLDGTGGGGFASGTDGSSSNFGVVVSSSTLQATNTVNIVIGGTGGGTSADGSNDNDGVRLTGTGTGARILSDSGAITITAFGGPGEDNNRGVLLNADTLVATTNGTISVTGTGGGGSDEASANFGVDIITARLIAGNAGTITLHGTGGGGVTDNSNDNAGVRLLNARALIESDAGAISITGIGGDGEVQNRGVQLGNLTRVLTTTGAITLHGTAGGGDFLNSLRNDGVYSDATIEQLAASPAAVTITGVGTTGPEFTDENIGVIFGRGGTSVVRTVTGNISVTGSGSGRLGDSVDNNDGIRMSTLGSRIESTSGIITLNGTGGLGEDVNRGILLNVGTTVSTVDGAVVLVGQGTGGFASGTDGSSGNYGIELSNARVLGIDTGTVSMQGTAGGTIADNSNANIGLLLVTAGALIQSNLGAIDLTGNGGPGEDGNRGLQVNSGTTVAATTGGITLTGTGGGGFTDAGNNVGIELAGSVASSGMSAAALTLIGSGGNGGESDNGNHGVALTAATSLIRSLDAPILIDGNGGATVTTSPDADNNYGVRLAGTGARIESLGNATITIDALGGGGRNGNSGCFLETGNIGTNAAITSVRSDITVTGMGGGNGGDAHGVYLEDFAHITTGSNGAITLIGTSGTTTNGRGVQIRDGAYVTAVDGAISINGAGMGSADSDGILLLDTRILATGSASITLEGSIAELTGEGLESSNTNNVIGGATATGDITIITDSYQATEGRIQSTGQLTIRPLSNGQPLWVGVGNSNIDRAFLEIGDNEIDNLVDGFTRITIGSANTGTVDIDSSVFTDPVTFSGQNVVVSQLDAGANAITLRSGTGAVSEGGFGSAATGAMISVQGLVSPGTNTVGEVTFNGAVNLPARYAVQVDSASGPGAGHDSLIANGSLTLSGTLEVSGTFSAPLGTTLTIIDNDGLDPVSGTFAGLPEGASFIGGANSYRVSYVGGTGNDVVLTVIDPLPAAANALPPERLPGGVRLRFQGAPNTLYNIEHTPGLNPSSWTVIDTPTSDGSGLFSFDFLSSDPRGYFRAASP
jgi:hypothetical protein